MNQMNDPIRVLEAEFVSSVSHKGNNSTRTCRRIMKS
jgi:hypothetical protein